jgi:predicted dienelactone hydrolase
MRGTSVARGGWFGASHDTEEALADAGFVVAAINHPGDTFSDSSQRDTLSVWESRPADIAAAVPRICTDEPAGFDRVAFHREFNAAVVKYFRGQLAER